MPRSTRSRATTAKRRGSRVPARQGSGEVVRQRFRDQILHDVAHGLIPRAVDEALRERGVEPVDTPDIRDVVVEEGQPLKFTATFETVPAIDPGDYSTITLRRAGARRRRLGGRPCAVAAARAVGALRAGRGSRRCRRRLGGDGSGARLPRNADDRVRGDDAADAGDSRTSTRTSRSTSAGGEPARVRRGAART